jgi:hypothetical protein
MWTKEFWKAVVERAVKTVCQAGVAAITAAGTGLIDTDWIGICSVAGMAAIVSVLTSIGSGAVTGGNTSITSRELVVSEGE